ncbi:MAG TPA: phage tail tape measure protein, partial [Balneolaceae bacterium]|nr:phage tail tape measure protein [Balneolaceae bacterium]
MEATEAKNVSDEFFVAVRNGKTTFGELSSAIGRVAPLAAATNTELSEVLAATAALTSSGLNTAESMTALRGILQKIIKPTEQAKKEAEDLGIEFNQSALEAQGLQGFLENVAEAAGGNSESIGKLFEDVEAFNGVLSLTGSASSAFNKNLGDMEEAAGTTDEALSKVEQNLSKIWETTKNRVNGVLIKLGKTVLPIVGSALSAFNKTLQES